MQNFIETLAYYWVDWQQAAISNTSYSIVLSILSMFIGGYIITALKRKRIIGLKNKIKQHKLQVNKAEKKYKNLLQGQINDAERVASLQLRIDMASSNLLEEKVKLESIVFENEELFLKETNKKQLEIDALNATILEKNQLIEQLKDDLHEKSNKTSLNSNAEEKFFVLEKKDSQSTAELNDLKLQLEKMREIEETKPVENLENESETKLELDKTILQQNLQLEIFNKKLLLLIDSTQKSIPYSVDKNTNNLDLVVQQSENIWKKHQQIIDQLTDQLMDKQKSFDSLEDEIHAAENDDSVSTDSLPETMVETADKAGFFSNKIKKFLS
ncbi:MAG: hypothetical protein L3J59_13285 [Methylococcaceae bacterium]|nr:hypothetical protein [Methylococcaceae bacterium]